MSRPTQATRRPTRREELGIQSRRKIVDAAAALMAERGFAGTSISAVSRRSGLPSGSIYWHFDSKEDLLAAVVEGGAALVRCPARAGRSAGGACGSRGGLARCGGAVARGAPGVPPPAAPHRPGAGRGGRNVARRHPPRPRARPRAIAPADGHAARTLRRARRRPRSTVRGPGAVRGGRGLHCAAHRARSPVRPARFRCRSRGLQGRFPAGSTSDPQFGLAWLGSSAGSRPGAPGRRASRSAPSSGCRRGGACPGSSAARSPGRA